MTIQNQIKGLNKISRDIPKQAEAIIKKSKEVILDLIRMDQLFEEGIDGKGNKLRPYTPYTMAVKRLEGKDPSVVTLFDTGDFYKRFDLVFTDQYAIGVFSRDIKTPELIEKYGADIFTFTVDNNRVLNEDIIKPKLIQWILSEIDKLLL